jgi:hypothetical protein
LKEGEGTAPSAEEVAQVRAAIVVPPDPPKKLTYKDIQAEWDAMSPDARDLYRPEALVRLQEAGHPTPSEKQVEPTMFKLFWVQKKGDSGGVAATVAAHRAFGPPKLKRRCQKF